jgi:hypothetical protein
MEIGAVSWEKLWNSSAFFAKLYQRTIQTSKNNDNKQSTKDDEKEIMISRSECKLNVGEEFKVLFLKNGLTSGAEQ